MRVIHLYTGDDSRSHHLERDAPTQTPFPALQVSFSVFADETQPHHPAPRRQLVMVLEGKIDIGCAGGDFRLEPGDVMLADDTAGEGHTTHLVGHVRTATVPLPETFDVDAWPPVAG